jgi:phosphopantothenoylcysteine synthetase/decarboxylase
MNILVTAGNTQTPIDRVRAISNIFTGRTGTGIALEAHRRGHSVTLLTSSRQTVMELMTPDDKLTQRWTVIAYRTFDDMQVLMADYVCRPGLDALIHCAAVSDYRTAGVYAPDSATLFHETERTWENTAGVAPTLTDMSAGKVKSDAEELWLRLMRTPKLVDRVRSDWGFEGVLVKFKLEVGVRDDVLLEIAERSRVHSSADVMVANTLEDSHLCAYVGPLDGMYHRIARPWLAQRVVEIVEGVRTMPGLDGAVPEAKPEAESVAPPDLVPPVSSTDAAQAVAQQSPSGPPSNFDRLRQLVKLLDDHPAKAPVAKSAHKVLLGVTGSVAAILTPDLFAALKRQGHEVKVVATSSALYFFDPLALDPTRRGRNPEIIVLDDDEWPGRHEGRHWQRGDPVLHIELRRWADLFLIAPLDANTLAKFANGMSDNCLTCVWRAWDSVRPRVLAPAMNTLMWEHPLTLRHLRQLSEDVGAGEPPAGVTIPDLLAWIESHCPNFRIVPPQSKVLAWGFVGVGALAPIDDILAAVNGLLATPAQPGTPAKT